MGLGPTIIGKFLSDVGEKFIKMFPPIASTIGLVIASVLFMTIIYDIHDTWKILNVNQEIGNGDKAIDVTIRGQIIDSNTGVPIDSAKILLHTEDKEIYTDKNGQFDLVFKRNINATQIKVFIIKKGYEGREYDLSMPLTSQDESIYFNMILKPDENLKTNQ